MIYAKIFLNSEGKLVFDAIQEYVRYHVYPAVPYVDDDGKECRNLSVTLTMVEEVAISPEAKSVLLEKFSFRNDNLELSLVEGDFEFISYGSRGREGEHGAFSFVPDSGKSSKTLDPDGIISIDRRFGYSLNIVNFMQVFDNDFLVKLDISKPYCPPSE